MCLISLIILDTDLSEPSSSCCKVRPADIVDGHPALTLQLIYAIATFAQLKEWGLKPPPALPSGGGHGNSSGRPLSRRLLNWRCLRDALLGFIGPRVSGHDDIPTVPLTNPNLTSTMSDAPALKSLPDLGPCLMDGKVLLALMHATDPQQCPYDPLDLASEGGVGDSSSGAGGGGGGGGSAMEDTRSPSERSERNRRRAFSRANHVFGVPPLLSDADSSDSKPRSSAVQGGGAAMVRGVGLESAAVAFRFEHLGMLYLSELCIRLGRSTAVSKDARAVVALTQQLEAATRRERCVWSV